MLQRYELFTNWQKNLTFALWTGGGCKEWFNITPCNRHLFKRSI